MVKVSRSSDTTIKVAMVANCDLANIKIALSIGSYTVECADVSNGEGKFVVSATEIAKLGGVNYYADLKSYNKKTSALIDAELVNVQVVETLAETKGYTTCRCTIPYEVDNAETPSATPHADYATKSDLAALEEKVFGEGGDSGTGASIKEQITDISEALGEVDTEKGTISSRMESVEEILGTSESEQTVCERIGSVEESLGDLSGAEKTVAERLEYLEENSSGDIAVVYDAKNTFGTENLRINRAVVGSALVDAVIDDLDAGKKVFLKCGDYKFAVISTVDSRAHQTPETRFRGFVCESLATDDASKIGSVEGANFYEERLVIIYHPTENKTYTYYSTDGSSGSGSASEIAALQSEVAALREQIQNIVNGSSALSSVLLTDGVTSEKFRLSVAQGDADHETLVLEAVE